MRRMQALRLRTRRCPLAEPTPYWGSTRILTWRIWSYLPMFSFALKHHRRRLSTPLHTDHHMFLVSLYFGRTLPALLPPLRLLYPRTLPRKLSTKSQRAAACSAPFDFHFLARRAHHPSQSSPRNPKSRIFRIRSFPFRLWVSRHLRQRSPHHGACARRQSRQPCR